MEATTTKIQMGQVFCLRWVMMMMMVVGKTKANAWRNLISLFISFSLSLTRSHAWIFIVIYYIFLPFGPIPKCIVYLQYYKRQGHIEKLSLSLFLFFYSTIVLCRMCNTRFKTQYNKTKLQSLVLFIISHCYGISNGKEHIFLLFCL